MPSTERRCCRQWPEPHNHPFDFDGLICGLLQVAAARRIPQQNRIVAADEHTVTVNTWTAGRRIGEPVRVCNAEELADEAWHLLWILSETAEASAYELVSVWDKKQREP